MDSNNNQFSWLQDFSLKAPLQDYYMMNSEIFTNEEQAQFQFLLAFMIPIKTSSHNYNLNTRLFYKTENENKSPVFMLHGHASTCVWAIWIKLAVYLFMKGFNILLMDLPAYGKSGVDNKDRVNPKYYLDDCHNMIIGVLDAFKFSKVHCIGFCGGAANFLRTIVNFPNRFAQAHVLHNSVIGMIPNNLEKILAQHKIKIWVSWCQDEDHSKYCVGYKFLQSCRAKKNMNIFLQDIKSNELACQVFWSKQMGRKTSDIEIFIPSDVSGYKQFVFDFLQYGNPMNYKINTNTNEDAAFQQILTQSEKDFIVDDQLEMAIALSLSLQNK